MKEVWKDIKGYEGYYRISSFGRVRTCTRTITYVDGRTRTFPRQILTLNLRRGSPYIRIMLHKEGEWKMHLLHRLVLETFVGPCPPGMECRHFPDRDPANNRLSNLQWGTRKEQLKDKQWHKKHKVPKTKLLPHKGGTRAKLRKNQILKIRRMYQSGLSCARLGEMFGVSLSSINNVVNERTWKGIRVISIL